MGNTILSVENLSVTLRKTGEKIIDGVSFYVNEGDVIAVSGKNGCGKSTLLRTIYGNTADYILDGKIIYDGKNILEFGDREITSFRSKVGYVQQKDDYAGFRVSILDLILDSLVAYSGENKPTKDEIIESFNSLGLRQYDSKGKCLFDVNTVCNDKLSGGQQRLVSILITMLSRPNAKLYIIDEPLNNLDFSNACKISNLINRIARKHNCAILMVTHCRIFPSINREIVMEKGRIKVDKEGFECHACFGEPNEEGYYE